MKKVLHSTTILGSKLHFNFLATRMAQKQLEATAATQASRLWGVDLDVLPKHTSILPTNRHELFCYILEDLLDCPLAANLSYVVLLTVPT
jgi:hypothetical protein